MKSSLPRGIKMLIQEAEASIAGISASAALTCLQDEQWLIVDVRDVRERSRDGFIPGSFHCPRGMIEFWIDPESPYYKDQFSKGRKLLFHCAADWRAMLTVHTVKQMGVADVFHLKGGLKAWKEANGAVAYEPE